MHINNKEKPNDTDEKFNVLDLFCGAGGLSRGFLDEGFNVVLGVDFDDAALKTFEKNHGETKALKLDLFNHKNIKYIEEYLKQQNVSVDVLVGGPPCQGFSLAGKRDLDDDRNILYSAMVKTAKAIKPKIVVLENVPGLLSLYSGKAGKRIKLDFEELGYKMSAKVLYAPNYGVPQIRKRVFFVGILNGSKEFDYPEPILSEHEYITTRQAIGDLPTLNNDKDFKLETTREYPIKPQNDYQKMMRRNSTIIYNHYPTKHEQKTVDNIAMVPEGGNYRDLPPELAKTFKYKESLRRYHGDKPSLTIDTGHRTHFHYEHNRIPSVRENARLQSFPDTFIFYGSKQEQYKQVGNAVPPLLGRALAIKIKELLKNEEV